MAIESVMRVNKEQPEIKVVANKLVPLDRLRNAKYNPSNRVEEDNLKELLASIDLIGLLCPVVVNPEYEIIDGHRRVACARILKWTDIECKIIEGDPALIYASINSSSRKMSGSDNLTIWLMNPGAVLSSAATKFKNMHKAIGREMCKKIASAGYSIRVFELAKRICRYCESESTDDLKLVVNWLIDIATIGQVGKALERGENPKLIMKAITSNKPLVFKMHVGE